MAKTTKAVKSKKVKHPKIDPLLISIEDHELQYVVNKMKGLGIKVTAAQVKKAALQSNHSRRKTYNLLKSKY